MDKKLNIYLKPHDMDASEQLVINIAGYYERIKKNHQISSRDQHALMKPFSFIVLRELVG